jgi:hypothetical protein
MGGGGVYIESYRNNLILKVAVFWVLALALMMEVAITSDTSLNFYQTTRRNNSEDSHLHTRRRENLKSHEFNFCWYQANINPALN